MSLSARLTWRNRPSGSAMPIPIGASANAVRKRSSLSRSAAVFWWSSMNTATLARRTPGSNGLDR